jgi:TPR repeat protein
MAPPPNNDNPKYDLATERIDPTMEYTFDQAKAGNTLAQNIMAEYYIAKNNLENAIPFYKMAAEGGNLDGIGNLFAYIGYAYRRKYDKSIAISGKTEDQINEYATYPIRMQYYYKLAADIGEFGAQAELGNLYEKDKDFENAIKYYKMVLLNNSNDYYKTTRAVRLSNIYEERENDCNKESNQNTFDLAKCYENANSLQNALIQYKLFINNAEADVEKQAEAKNNIETIKTKLKADCEDNQFTDPYELAQCYEAKDKSIAYRYYKKFIEEAVKDTDQAKIETAKERITVIYKDLKEIALKGLEQINKLDIDLALEFFILAIKPKPLLKEPNPEGGRKITRRRRRRHQHKTKKRKPKTKKYKSSQLKKRTRTRKRRMH